MTKQTSIATPYPWQQDAWQVFNRQLSKKKLSHALLISGLAGIGKQQLARAAGQLLLCLEPVQSLACGHCKGCTLFNAETHPDFHVITPETGKQIKVEDIRALQERLNNSAQQGGRKVVVLGPGESLNLNAANAFLKTLEEPPGNTHILMVTNELSRVLPTISSRCQLIKLPLPNRPQSLDWLTKFAGDKAKELLDAAAGLPVKALSLLESDALEERSLIITELSGLSRASQGPVSTAAKLASVPLETICLVVVDLLEKQVKIMVQDLTGCANNGQVRAQKLLLLRSKTIDLLSRLRSGFNPNKQLALEELLIDYARL